jgi:integrase
MPRQINRLSARAVETLKKPGRHSDGGGLYLSVANDGRRRWTFLYRWKDDRSAKGSGGLKEMGLGALTAVSLAKARELAGRCRAELAGGIDPRKARDERIARTQPLPTFGKVADELVDAKEPGWRSAKHAAQWRYALKEHAAPLRAKLVDKITTDDVLEVLKPIWHSKSDTAKRLRARIENVLDAARSKAPFRFPPGWANPARWRGHLKNLLSAPKKLSRGHYRALPFTEVPGFVDRLRRRPSTTALALEFLILTAARTGEAIAASWSEIDLKAKIWTVPGERMKRGIEHRVPLSDRAIEILETMAKGARGEFVFPGTRANRPLSPAACTQQLRRMKVNSTVHGFRSAFRDWCGEATSFPREIAEGALSHVVGDETERSYRRGDALAKRRKLMEAWASYCTKSQGANVLKPKFGKARG